MAAALMVPFVLAGPTVDRWFASFEERSAVTWTVAVVIVALLAVDVVAPIPSSLVAAFAGTAFGPWLGSVLVFVGLSVGCALGYLLAAWIRPGMLQTDRGSSALRSASALGRRDGAVALVVARPVPLLAEATVVVAGLTSMRWSTFAGACCLGNLLVALLFAGLPGALA